MKIHFPLLGFNLSGGIRVIVTLANGLVERGHEVRVTVPAFRSEPPIALHPKVDKRVIGEISGTRLGYFKSLVKEAAKWGDLLVATNSKTPLILSKSRERNKRKIPLLYLAQGYDPIEQGELFDGPFLKRWTNKRIALRSYGLADYRCYLTHYVAERVGLDPDPVVIRCGVDASIFHPGPKSVNDKLRIGVIGRYVERKGLPVFFKSWEALSDVHDRAEVIVWPAGADDRFRPPKGGSIYPVCDDKALAGFYRSLDLFVFPTLFEGFGLPPLEAIACGVPVVLTDSGGVREFAKDGQNCLMVPPGDAESLAIAIRRAIESPDLRAALAKEGIETANRFTWEDTIERFHQGMLRAMEDWGTRSCNSEKRF